jgi:large subunit ribosomal protein L4
MLIDILDNNAMKVSEKELGKAIAGGKINEDLFYEVVKMQLANRRSGTASTKTKGEVSGGGVKPFKQKGTGRARSGSIRSPLWRHGGTVFGPHPRDYSYSVPRKVKKEALLSALRLKVQQGELKIFDSLELKEPKTKSVLDIFKKAKLSNALIVVDGAGKNLKLAVRNLKDFKLIEVAGLNVYDLLNYKELVMTKAALLKVEATA